MTLQQHFCDAGRSAKVAIYLKRRMRIEQIGIGTAATHSIPCYPRIDICEGIAQLSSPPAQGALVTIEHAHVALVHTPQLIFTGLQLTFGRFLDDGTVAFSRLQKTASALQPVTAAAAMAHSVMLKPTPARMVGSSFRPR